MSHITANAGALVPPHDDHGHSYDLSPANTTIAPAVANRWAFPLIGAGVILLLATVVVGATSPGLLKHALAALHIGLLGVLASALGAMFFVLAFHLTMAGWSITVRRQLENMMTFAPLAGLAIVFLLLYEMFTGGHLFVWMGKSVADDVIFQRKAGFFNPMFFMIRALVYVAVWALLAWKLRGYSTEQDRTGDRWLSNKARFTSSWGVLAFGLTTAFAAFDWIMSLDYRFFSTMWGVYFFAGAAFVSVPVLILVLMWLQARGTLKGLVNEEHYHDLGKFMFGFTVFWAYIGFSQYFLIWYANIPEETFFMVARKMGPWRAWTILLVFGHFILPFWVLLWRFMRRSNALLSLMAIWMILMEVADLYWIVRPLVYAGTPGAEHPFQQAVWLDVVGIAGPWLLFLGLLAKMAASGPLIPMRDPRLGEALQHRNYV
jgi:hypothetical protein